MVRTKHQQRNSQQRAKLSAKYGHGVRTNLRKLFELEFGAPVPRISFAAFMLVNALHKGAARRTNRAREHRG